MRECSAKGFGTHRVRASQRAGALLLMTGTAFLATSPIQAAVGHGRDGSPFHDPVDVTRPDTVGASGDPLRPQLVWIEQGHIMLPYQRGNDVRILRTTDGVSWGSANEGIRDLPLDVGGGRSSRVVRTRDGFGIAWPYRESFEAPRLRYTPLTPDGRPRGPSVLIDDGIVNPGDSRLLSIVALASDAQRHIVAVWTEDTFGDGSVDQRIRWSLSTDDGATWSDPTEYVKATYEIALFAAPFLSLDPKGRVHLLITDDHIPGEISLFRLEVDTHQWTRVGAPPREDGRVIRGPSVLSAAPDGAWGVVATTAREPVSPPTSITFWRSHDEGASWSDPIEVSQDVTPDNHYDAKLACDTSGRWHAAWISAPPGSPAIDVYYSTSSDGVSWTTPLVVNPEPGSAAPSVPYSVSIATDDQDEVYIAYMHKPEVFANPDAIYVLTTRDVAYDPLDGASPFEVCTAPNPFRVLTRLQIASPGEGVATIRLYDASGRLVRRWSRLGITRGIYEVEWNGRLESGREAPAGVYFWDAGIDTEVGRQRARARSVRVR